MSGRKLEQGKLGWAIDSENVGQLEATGTEPGELLKWYRDTFPKFNTTADPLGVVDILDQQSQGACAGHALAQVFSICYFLATGRKAAFSRGGAYYLAQQKDGIRGDQGSTLSGCNWVATQHGLCLESDWPYPSRYNPKMPSSAEGKFVYKLKSSKPLKDIVTIVEWLELGLPIQTGLTWNDSCNEEIVDRYSNRSGGGHSTVFWQRRPSQNVVNINSWGTGWSGDGCHEWTLKSIETALAGRWTVFIGYAPAGMEYPVPDAIA